MATGESISCSRTGTLAALSKALVAHFALHVVPTIMENPVAEFESLPAIAQIAVIFAAIFCMVYATFMYRARAMRALAARWGLRYVGPPTPTWLCIPKIKPHVPVPLGWYPANKIRQAWNVVEGQHRGVPVVFFDCLFGDFGPNTYQYLTIIACPNEPYSCGLEVDSDAFLQPDHITQSHGWTMLYQLPRFLMNPFTTWGMSIQRLEHHLSKVGAAVGEAGLKTEGASFSR